MARPLGERLAELGRQRRLRRGEVLFNQGDRAGELRFAHLVAHLRTTELLTDEQIERYDQLRGYR